MKTLSILPNALIIICVGMATQSAQAARYQIYQGGFENNGYVMGYFEGEDKDGDNKITASETQDEAIRAVLFFKNKDIDPVELPRGGNGRIESLSYDLLANSLTDFYMVGEVLSRDLITSQEFDEISTLYPGSDTDVVDSSFSYSASLLGGTLSVINTWYVDGIDGFPGTENSNSTSSPVQVTETPIPGALGLFMAGLSGLGLIKKRKKPV